MSTDALESGSKNRGQSYFRIFLPISAPRGVIALLIGTLTKSERSMLSRQFPFRLIICPLMTSYYLITDHCLLNIALATQSLKASLSHPLSLPFPFPRHGVIAFYG